MLRASLLAAATVVLLFAGVASADNTISVGVDKVECGQIYLKGSIGVDCGYVLDGCPEVDILVFRNGELIDTFSGNVDAMDNSWSGIVEGSCGCGDYEIIASIVIYVQCTCPPSGDKYSACTTAMVP